MKFETKESSPCVVALSVAADAEEVKGTYKKVVNAFLRNGVIPGFRKGKAPLGIVMQKFAEQIKEEGKQSCFREFYPKALEESKLEALGLNDVQDIVFAPETTGFSFTALVEVKPKFELPKYRKLAINKNEPKVEDKDVDEDVERFRKAFAKYEDAKDDAVVAAGDYACIDYSGALEDGTPLSEVVPDEKIVIGEKGFWLQVEDGHFVPEILAALKGMKAGETKDAVKVEFPKEAAPEALKGKTCVYSVTLKSFRSRRLPDDAEFIAGAKAESMDALRKQTRERLERQAEAAEQQSRKDQAIDLLLEKAEFDLPPSQVARQTRSQLDDIAKRAMYSGLPADYFEKNKEQILADAQNNAIRQLRISYVLLGIADAEKIAVTDDDAVESLKKIAADSDGRMTYEDLRKDVDSRGQFELYKEQLRAEKALQFVLDQSK